MQRCTRLAEQMVESALSRVGCIEDETRRVRELVEATRSVHGEVEAKVAMLVAQTTVSASQAVEAVQVAF